MRLFLGFVARLLTFYDPLGDPPCLEKVNRYRAIVASIHLSIEYLLDDVVNNIVEKVVPRKAEKEILFC
jgi:hypothetical protein